MPESDPPAKERLDVAARRLEEAEGVLREGFHIAAVHEAYYAAFHAAMAALGTEGSNPRSHRGTISEFGRLFVQTGRFPKDVAAILEDLLDLRLRGDYDIQARVQEDEARAAVEDARAFIDAVQGLLGS